MQVTCNCTTKTDHCRFKCVHGDVHEADTGKEGCRKFEFCDIVGKRVKCRPLFKKEVKELEERR